MRELIGSAYQDLGFEERWLVVDVVSEQALDTWQAVLVPSGDAARSLRVVQPDWVDVHCVRQIGLRTDTQVVVKNLRFRFGFTGAPGSPPPGGLIPIS